MIYLKLFIAFLKVGLFSFGGAYAAIPLIRDVVLSYGWLNDEQLSYMIAVSESTPGPVMVNTATYVGSSVGGILGSATATFAVVLPAFVIILLIMVVFKSLLNNKYFSAVLNGLKPCIIGIIAAVGAVMILENTVLQNTPFDVKNVIITVILALVLYLSKPIFKKKISPIQLISVSAVLGVVFFGI